MFKKNRALIIDFLVVIVFLFTAAFSIGLLLADTMKTFSTRNAEPVGTVVTKKNIVQRRPADRILWDRLTSDSSIYSGDLIRVAALSGATLDVEGSSIELEQNTLIRITPARGGDALQIALIEGGLSLVSRAQSRIFLELNGRQARPVSEAAFSVKSAADGIVLQVDEGAVQFTDSGAMQEFSAGRQMALDSKGVEYAEIPQGRNARHRENAALNLRSPIAGSVFRFSHELPVLNFQWDEAESALSYILEVCSTPDFSAPQIRRQSRINFFSVNLAGSNTVLGEGMWYWSVRPVFRAFSADDTTFLQTSHFRIEKIFEPEREDLSFAEWFAGEIPPELLSAVPPPVPSAAPLNTQLAADAPAEPVSPLPAARNLAPAMGRRFTMNDLQAQRSISFSWQAVQGANAYILTIFRETEGGGRRQIYRTQPLSYTGYSLEDLRILDNGNFIWQVEAVSRRAGGAIDRRGNTAESMFIMDIILPGAIQVEGR